MTVKLRAGGWEWGGEPHPWLFLQVNYWEFERSHWRDVLKAVSSAGQNVISAAVPPSVHWISSDQYDFGTHRPNADLGAFLAEVKSLGMKAFLWLGPRDLPGVPAAGYPAELLEAESALARDAQGRLVPSSRCQGGEVFALPCLLSHFLTDALQPFASSLQPILEPWLDPDGPVIGLGLSQAPGWRNALGAYAADYHPEALSAYRDWLKRRYGKVDSLNRAYGEAHPSFAEVQPPAGKNPRQGKPETYWLDWAQYREEYFVRAAERLHRLFAPLAQGRIPLLLATLPTVSTPFNLTELEKLRAFDAFWPEWPLLEGDEAILRISTENRFAADLRAVLPALEAESEAEFEWLKRLILGARGWDIVSAAGSGAYPGFLCDRRGHGRRLVAPLWPALQEAAKPDGFLSSQLHAEVMLVAWPRLERLRALSADPRHSLDFSPRPAGTSPGDALEPEAQAWLERWRQIEEFLRCQQFPYGILNAEAGADRWTRTTVVIAASFEKMEADEQQRLVQKVQSGLPVILIGPLPQAPEGASSPTLAELASVKPSKSNRGKNAKTGRLIHLADFSDLKLLRALQQVGGPRPVVFEPAPDRVFFHKYRNRVFIAALNGGASPLETTARREGKFVLHDLWNQSKYWGGNHEIKVNIGPRQIKWWELIEC